MTPAHIYSEIDLDPVAAFARHTGRPTAILERLPNYMRPGLVRFVLLGIKPGSFLMAIFADEQENARVRADSLNAGLLERYRDFLEFEAPADCWGAPEKVRSWHERGGLFPQTPEMESA